MMLPAHRGEMSQHYFTKEVTVTVAPPFHGGWLMAYIISLEHSGVDLQHRSLLFFTRAPDTIDP